MEVLKRAGFPEYICGPCGYIYDPRDGDPKNFVFPGTPFDGIHKGWSCPVCGTDRAEFELLSGFADAEMVFAH